MQIYNIKDMDLKVGEENQEYNLPCTRHAANEYEGWVKIVNRFRLSHEPMGMGSIERVTV